MSEILYDKVKRSGQRVHAIHTKRYDKLLRHIGNLSGAAHELHIHACQCYILDEKEISKRK